MTLLNRRALCAGLCTMLGAPALRAQTAPYPARPITFVVPTPPGGAVDVLTRALADEMARRLGQTIVVENKSGASGMLAAQAVARAAPDGYTVLVTNATPIVNVPLMFAKVPYDVQRDFAFVTQYCAGQFLFTVNAQDVPARTMKEFVAWAAQHKGRVSYGSYGTGTVGHLLGAYLSQSRALDMTHVPYKGEAPMVQDLMGGQLSWAVTSSGTVAAHLQSGRLRALAVIGDHRMKDLPQLPTMAEAGFADPEFAITAWLGVLAPAGTPAPVLARLEAEARAATQATPVKARLQIYGMEPAGDGAEAFRRRFQALMPTYERLIRVSGAKAE